MLQKLHRQELTIGRCAYSVVQSCKDTTGIKKEHIGLNSFINTNITMLNGMFCIKSGEIIFAGLLPREQYVWLFNNCPLSIIILKMSFQTSNINIPPTIYMGIQYCWSVTNKESLTIDMIALFYDEQNLWITTTRCSHIGDHYDVKYKKNFKKLYLQMHNIMGRFWYDCGRGTKQSDYLLIWRGKKLHFSDYVLFTVRLFISKLCQHPRHHPFQTITGMSCP